jgi:hypothetical protein
MGVVHDADVDELLRLLDGQSAQAHGVEELKDCGVRPDAERERKHGHDRERRVDAKSAAPGGEGPDQIPARPPDSSRPETGLDGGGGRTGRSFDTRLEASSSARKAGLRQLRVGPLRDEFLVAIPRVLGELLDDAGLARRVETKGGQALADRRRPIRHCSACVIRFIARTNASQALRRARSIRRPAGVSR